MTVFFLSHASTSGCGPRTVTFLEVVLRVVLTVCRPERLLERCLQTGPKGGCTEVARQLRGQLRDRTERREKLGTDVPRVGHIVEVK